MTEQSLDDILKKLSKEITLVIIAHRLNTIEGANEIFFVSGGKVKLAGSMENAVSSFFMESLRARCDLFSIL